MIVMVISLASGLDFSFEAPEIVEQGEEFEVIISGETDEVYDVKIYVHDDVKASSEIYDGTTWKNTYFYLKDVFPDQEVFKLRAHFLGDTEICVQMRKSGDSSFDKLCKEISVEESNEQIEEDEDLRGDEDDEDNDEPDSEENGEEIVRVSNNLVAENKPNEKIVLNAPKKENANDREVFISKQQKVRTGVLYGFTSLIVLIVILLALRKL